MTTLPAAPELTPAEARSGLDPWVRAELPIPPTTSRETGNSDSSPRSASPWLPSAVGRLPLDRLELLTHPPHFRL